MNGVQSLSSDDFVLQETVKGNVLCNKIKGVSLVLFYSTNCQHSQALIPVFKQLPRVINGCYFGFMNVNNNRRFIEASANTLAPIRYVPLMILYYDGKPYKKYPEDAPHELRAIADFVSSVYENIKRIQTEQKRVQAQGGPKPPGGGHHVIPDFTIGHPVKGDKKEMVTYLKELEAYIKK
jgi:hypothetical protein